MYGAQTTNETTMSAFVFENDVEMYGAQTHISRKTDYVAFENDVEMYGAQTTLLRLRAESGLRMM